MKRQDIINLLRSVKPDGDIGDTVDSIMAMNGADIENAKKNSGIAELEAQNVELQRRLDEYEKPDGAKYIDPKEHERLKQYETDSISAKKKSSAEAAFGEMLARHKVVPDIIKMALKGINADDVKLGDDGKVTEEYETAYMEAFKKDYPNSFVAPVPGTGNPVRTEPVTGGQARKQSLSEILQERK